MSLPLPTHQNQQAEEAILCAMLNQPERIATISQGLPPEHFFHPCSRLVYTHLLTMGGETEIITLPLLTERLMASGDLDKIGGASEIVRLFNLESVPIDAAVNQCKVVLRDTWTVRQGINVMSEAMAESAMDGRSDPHAWIMATVERLQGLVQDAGLTKHRSMKELVLDAIDRYQQAATLNGKLCGISTGFAILDGLTGGFMPGHLWVVGGGSSDGKSAFCQQLMLRIGMADYPCAIYTLEMSDAENVDRFFCQDGEISSESIMRGTFSQQEIRKFSYTSKRLQDAPIHIRDVSGIKKSELLADMRLLWRIHKIKVFSIDYGQLIASEGKHFSREREVADLSASLKAFAKQTQSTVIFVSQLNEDGKLRESRAIGFDADKAIRLRVPEKEGKEGDLDDTKRILHLDKNRGGRRYEKIVYDFDGPTFRFINERKYEEP